MKAAGPGRWRLGLFVVGGLLAAVGLLLWLGVRQLSQKAQSFVTWFDQSVGGLEPGSPVVFRGIQVGRVGAVGIAADGRHIEVWTRLFESQLRRLEMDPAAPPPPSARFRLGLAGLTGGGQIELLFVDPAGAPPPPLPASIVPPPNYIPPLPARFTSLQDAVAYVVGEVTPAVEDLRSVLREAEARVVALDTAQMNTEALAGLRSLRRAAEGVEALAGRLTAPDGALAGTLEDVRAAAATLERAVSRADVEGAVRAVGQAGTGVAEATTRFGRLADRVDAQLATLQRTLESVRRLVDLLERNPSVLLRGREPPPGRR